MDLLDKVGLAGNAIGLGLLACFVYSVGSGCHHIASRVGYADSEYNKSLLEKRLDTNKDGKIQASEIESFLPEAKGYKEVVMEPRKEGVNVCLINHNGEKFEFTVPNKATNDFFEKKKQYKQSNERDYLHWEADVLLNIRLGR
jgi:hypothetical protein